MDEGLLPFPNGGMIESRWKKDEVMCLRGVVMQVKSKLISTRVIRVVLLSQPSQFRQSN